MDTNQLTHPFDAFFIKSGHDYDVVIEKSQANEDYYIVLTKETDYLSEGIHEHFWEVLALRTSDEEIVNNTGTLRDHEEALAHWEWYSDLYGMENN
jgi:hypothetical protein